MSDDQLPKGTIHPRTRRLIVITLGVIATICIIAEVALAGIGAQASDALMAVAASCTGGIAGLAVPPSPPGD